MIERKILATQGLIKDKNIFIYNVKISNGHIHTLEAGRQNSKKMVLIHGFGASGTFFFKMIFQLKNYFHVFVIDQYGTGLSTRPVYKAHGFKKAENFFCGAIEEWRKKLKIEEFILVGHSFGGFTAARYLISRTPKVKKLFLLSPAGFTKKEKGEIFNNYQETKGKGRIIKNKLKKKENFFERLETRISGFFEKYILVPQQIGNILGRQNLIHLFFSSDRFGFTEKEAKLISEFNYLVSELNYSGEKALGSFLFYTKYSKNPLVKDLRKIQLEGKLPETHVYYGENDYMDFEHSKIMIRKYGLRVKYEIVKESCHQLPFNAHDTICKKIVESCGYRYRRETPQDFLNENFKIINN